jgi:hypothetical protein
MARAQLAKYETDLIFDDGRKIHAIESCVDRVIKGKQG